MGGGSDLQRLSGGENCVLGPRRGSQVLFTNSLPGDDAAVLAPSSEEEPAPPRHRAGVASMACIA